MKVSYTRVVWVVIAAMWYCILVLNISTCHYQNAFGAMAVGDMAEASKQYSKGESTLKWVPKFIYK